jgi:hypothetical protein
MKKILWLFMFIFGLVFCEANGGVLHFFIPTTGQVIQSGNNQFIPGVASIEFSMFLDQGYTGDIYSWKTQITYPDGQKSALRIGQWGYMNSNGGWDVTKVGAYKITGYVHCKDILGRYTDQTCEVNFTVEDHIAPVKPQNLQVFQSSNNHPRLTWNSNQEQDLSTYKIYKKRNDITGWQYLNSTSSPIHEYVDATENYGTGTSSPINYRVTAYDINGNESIPSDYVTTIVLGSYIETKPSDKTIFADYSLKQNYPNPFNPSTAIQYEVKDPGLVKLEVYNILGNKIKDLVNELQGTGVYNVVFDASNLPSGIYIYKINVNNYSAFQKMSLVK